MRPHNCKTDCGRVKRHRITINEVTMSTDGNNTETHTALFRNVRAHRKETAAGETVRGGGVLSKRKTVYEIDYRQKVYDSGAKWSVTDGATTRNITDVIEPDNGRNRRLFLHCLEDVG